MYPELPAIARHGSLRPAAVAEILPFDSATELEEMLPPQRAKPAEARPTAFFN